MSTPRLGYIKSPRDVVGTHSAAKLLAAAPLPSSWDNDQYVMSVLDQLQTGTCTCNAGTQSIRMAHVKQGVSNPELASRLFLYFLARAQYGQEKADDGTFIHAVYEAANRMGFPPESAWPFSDDPMRVNQQPDWRAFQAANDQRWGVDGYARINSDGNQRIEDVKRAVAAGHGVEVGSDIDQSFMDLGGNAVWGGVRGPVLGGHAFLVTGYDSTSFTFVNSWGPGWCRNGFGRFSYSALLAMDDIWFSIVAPTYSETA